MKYLSLVGWALGRLLLLVVFASAVYALMLWGKIQVLSAETIGVAALVVATSVFVPVHRRYFLITALGLCLLEYGFHVTVWFLLLCVWAGEVGLTHTRDITKVLNPQSQVEEAR